MISFSILILHFQMEEKLKLVEAESVKKFAFFGNFLFTTLFKILYRINSESTNLFTFAYFETTKLAKFFISFSFSLSLTTCKIDILKEIVWKRFNIQRYFVKETFTEFALSFK